LSTAWHAHEVFVKCRAVVHKTDVLTFRLHDGFGADITRACDHQRLAQSVPALVRSIAMQYARMPTNLRDLEGRPAGGLQSRCLAQMRTVAWRGPDCSRSRLLLMRQRYDDMARITRAAQVMRGLDH
jgi:hypothetical protein